MKICDAKFALQDVVEVLAICAEGAAQNLGRGRLWSAAGCIAHAPGAVLAVVLVHVTGRPGACLWRL